MRKKERKKEIIEDKNNYNSKIFDFTNKHRKNIKKGGAEFGNH